MQIDQSNIDVALDLLKDGFPKRSTAFWERGLARLQAYRAHRQSGEDIGQLLYVDAEPVGVGLTAVSHHPGDEPGSIRRTVNLASWYIDPAHRWRLPVLISRLLRDPNAVYTDLTPTPALWPLLGSLGFEPLNGGISAICVPAAAVYHAASCAVVDWDQADKSHLPDTLIETFEDHRAYGCCPYVAQTTDASVPILIKPCKVKGIPAAQVIYCGDNRLLAQAVGGLCRKLGRRGILALLVDIPPRDRSWISPISVPLRSRCRRFIKNGRQSNVTDYTYSELVFFDY